MMKPEKVTNSDKSRQLNDDELSQKQMIAIDLVVSGMPDGEVAKKLGLARQTINKWRNHDLDFKYILACRRLQIMESFRDKLTGMAERAIEILAKNMESADEKVQNQSAQIILRLSGLQGYMRPEKEVDREALNNQMERGALSQALAEVTKELGFTK
jgi:transposase-like protein